MLKPIFLNNNYKYFDIYEDIYINVIDCLSELFEAFQKGQFDNKSYSEIDKELNIVDEKFFQLEIEFEKKFYNKNPTKFNEE